MLSWLLNLSSIPVAYHQQVLLQPWQQRWPLAEQQQAALSFLICRDPINPLVELIPLLLEQLLQV
jgi:hypothetical protein